MPGCARSWPGTSSTCIGEPRPRMGLADGDWVEVDQPAWRTRRPAPADGRLRREHRLDLERDRQARRRLGPGGRCARGEQRLPAEPRHRRAAAGGARLQPGQRRPDHRPGGLVRPARASRQGCRGRSTAVSAPHFASVARPSYTRHDRVRPRQLRARSSSAWSSTSTPASAAMPAPPPAGPGTTRAIPARSARPIPMARTPEGAWLNRVHSFEADDGACGRTVHFPRSCLHCAEPACVTVCPTGRLLQARRRTASSWSTPTSASAVACAPGPAPTARASWTRSSM